MWQQGIFTDCNKVVHIDHGYDESKPESELTLEDMKKAVTGVMSARENPGTME